MTDKETMKMALEFIERVNKEGWILDDFEPQMYEAIAALKERLAQPEQEPVAWISPKGHIHFEPYLDSVPLYTHPPQRTWVGLTDEDWDEIFGNSLTIGAAIKNTEAKLRSKNI